MFRFLIVLAFSLLTDSMFAREIKVCSSCEIKSIQSALVAALDGDTIRIYPGIYMESDLEIRKRIVLLGENGTVLDGGGTGEVIVVHANGVVIKDLQIQNVGVSYIKELSAIRLAEADSCLIENNRLINTFFGIYLAKSTGTIIRDNFIMGNAIDEASSGNAIHLWYSNHAIIENNQVINHRDGIYLEFVDNSVIANNVSKDNLRYGLHFMFSNDDAYHGNHFEENGAGVAVMYSRNITMTHNKFTKNWGPSSYGLLLKEIYDGEISGNEFVNNTIGIFAESSNRINFYHNDFRSNGIALKVYGSCMDNTFRENNFLFNTFDLTSNSSQETNDYSHNYWSDYAGYDLDKDGIGDIPYRPIKLFSFINGQVPESIVLLRSLFVDILNFAEMVTPIYTPKSLIDPQPLVSIVKHD